MVLNPILETIQEEIILSTDNNIIYESLDEIDLVRSDDSYDIGVGVDIEATMNNDIIVNDINIKNSIHPVKIYCTVFLSLGVILTGCIYVMSILKRN
jgi:hypothetical protein